MRMRPYFPRLWELGEESRKVLTDLIEGSDGQYLLKPILPRPKEGLDITRRMFENISFALSRLAVRSEK